ncbi:MAG: acetyl-CoA carboxylase carboxyltransferase subunit alpha [Defluviitaleaceae bacterium]|nr:acetyl-CoA carboxylase carboxyltransferase subunit alpha [Defluviitaleaceae bacterium]
MSTAYEHVKAARAKDRPTGVHFINTVVTDFVELHGDRRFADDAAVVGGIGRLKDMPVTVIALEKGQDIKDKLRRNFGAANPEGYRKALRLMKQAEKFGRPVICFVDTAGAFPGVGAEERGQGQAIAENLLEMMTLKVPTISIIIGEGGSGGAIALAAADRVWMMERAIYSVISPEGCASILWKDAGKAAEAAESLRLTSEDMHRLGVVERVIAEGETAMAELKDDLYGAVSELLALDVDARLDARYQRFRKFGENL